MSKSDEMNGLSNELSDSKNKITLLEEDLGNLQSYYNLFFKSLIFKISLIL
jgi:hypothetical protein